MSVTTVTYCLDSNVLIQAWQKYYSPDLCPNYWKVLDELGAQGRIFIPEDVYKEITKTEDDLAAWLKDSKIPIVKVNEQVTACTKKIFSTDPVHKTLVDNRKGRSVADPWVIAHAMHAQATVVTKEEMITASSSKRIKIPNVCQNMNVRCIDDFQFIKELNITFDCTHPTAHG